MHHPRYSATRNHQHDYTNRINSDGAIQYNNGLSNVHDSYPAAVSIILQWLISMFVENWYVSPQYFSRSNANSHDATSNNGARFGNRLGFNNKYQGWNFHCLPFWPVHLYVSWISIVDAGDGQSGSYDMSDVNNNATKRPSDDTVQNATFE